MAPHHTDPDLSAFTNAAAPALAARALSRRRLLKFGGVALAATAAAPALAACGAGSSAQSGTSGAASSSTDTLTVATATAGTVFDPEQPSGIFQYTMLYDSLFDTSTPPDSGELAALLADYEPEAALATAWESNKDNSVWTITLNTDAMSPAGNSLTSADVMWSFERHLAMKWYGGIFLNRVGVTDISQIEAPSDDTIVMNLAGPIGRTYFLQLMGCFIVPIFDATEAQANATDDDPWAQDYIASNACGFGPYQLQSVAADGTLNVFEANPNYYGEVAIPTVTFRTTTETSTQLQLLLRGEAQVIDALSPVQIDEVESSDSAKVVTVANTGYTFLGFNNEEELYQDVALHQGIAYALPFDDIVNSVFRGQATSMKSVLPSFFQGFTDEYWVYDQDLDKATEMLAPYAGQGLKLQYKGGSTLLQSLAVLIQSSLSDVGLDVELVSVDPTTFAGELTEATLLMWLDNQSTPLVPDSLYGLQLLFPSDPTQVLIHYSNDVVDEAVGALATSFDPDEQVELIRTAQKQIMADLPILPLAETGGLIPVASNIDGVKGHGANIPWGRGYSYSA
ncbi:ABC transporter substrate-binding protein [Nocardioides bruguierae]|uniref:ABC transporter substrate-binding protein n=1 Tax=Nocardioides bruguierae TaxID=2945102 RepID=UPI002020A0A8|nr:ABC transporter substrate-binding protein [Nocardioides bruguierae]MCL8025746.1 ABC transporter substrate-binding protein [Nocardioides bruguierae]